MDNNTTYEAPTFEVLGSVHELTLVVKIIGGDLDGTFLKVGRKLFPLGLS